MHDTVTVLVESTDGAVAADADGSDGIGVRRNNTNLNGFEMNRLSVVRQYAEYS